MVKELLWKQLMESSRSTRPCPRMSKKKTATCLFVVCYLLPCHSLPMVGINRNWYELFRFKTVQDRVLQWRNRYDCYLLPRKCDFCQQYEQVCIGLNYFTIVKSLDDAKSTVEYVQKQQNFQFPMQSHFVVKERHVDCESTFTDTTNQPTSNAVCYITHTDLDSQVM